MFALSEHRSCIHLTHYMHNYSVTFATLNCLEHTKKCVESLLASGVSKSRLVAVDNASTDGTQQYLAQLGLGGAILNRQNLSCGAAWNQGILAQQSEWTIVMNNDIVVAPGFAHRLIEFAGAHQLKLVSPARIDGTADTDFTLFAAKLRKTMDAAVRGAIEECDACGITWSRCQSNGCFRANPTLWAFCSPPQPSAAHRTLSPPHGRGEAPLRKGYPKQHENGFRNPKQEVLLRQDKTLLTKW